MKILTNNKTNALILSFFCLVILIYFIYYQITDRYLWYDESGQFYISAGLNHYSEPLSKFGSLYDVLKYNALYNLDPGGFSVLLHYWITFSTNVYWLRVLPLLFYLVHLIFLYKSVKIVYNDNFYSIVVVILNLLSLFQLMPHPAVELRAYSMELCGMSMSLYLFLYYSHNLSISNVMKLSLIMCLFCTSRYAFIMSAFGFSIVVIYYIFKENELKKDSLIQIFSFGIPLVVIVLFIFLFMMCKQNPEAQSIKYAPYIYSNTESLYSPLSLFYYIQIVLFVIFKEYKKETRNILPQISIVVSSIFFILSMLNLYPWDPYKNISMTFLLYNSIIMYIIRIVQKWKYTPIATMVILFAFVFKNRVHLHRFNIDEPFLEETERFMKTHKNSSIFFDSKINPSIRYQFEYGSLYNITKDCQYPIHFIFQPGKIHSFVYDVKNEELSQPKKASDYDCDFYVFGLYGNNYPDDFDKFEAYDNYKYVFVKKP